MGTWTSYFKSKTKKLHTSKLEPFVPDLVMCPQKVTREVGKYNSLYGHDPNLYK